jgi:hypothetical protein
MRTNFTRDPNPMFKRALKASLVALVIVGGGCTWQKLASEHIADRAEQARLAQLRMTPRKWEALKREAKIAAAAKAYAETLKAEKANAEDSHVARGATNQKDNAQGI